MINKKTVLAIIPARGGSKGLPDKNIKPLNGKPLIVWTIEQANASKYIDTTIVSTDNQKIADIAKQHQAQIPFTRPPELATDEAASIDCIIHAINTLQQAYDYIVLLQPTSPLRNSTDIDKCIELSTQKDQTCVSVTKTDKPPQWIFFIDENQKMLPILPPDNMPTRRQECKKAYSPNGAVYVAKTKNVMNDKTFFTKETIAYIMPPERSLDIDTLNDLKYCEFLLKENQK